ncbi:MAG TPA: hypothetical protein VFP55_11930 [Solirubrobacteraceae bacterium]|nr:hypothetical protein [Solirubrobacteraceae bacterium]
MAAERDPQRAALGASRSLLGLLLGGGLLGAVVLAVSQFLNLYGTHIRVHHRLVATATAGSEHAYALLPVAIAAAVLAYGVWKVASRPALLGLGLLGLAALLIALLHDLPYAHRQGLWNLGGHFVLAVNRPEIGLYAETAGALLLLLTVVCGFVLLGSPEPHVREARGPLRTQ